MRFVCAPDSFKESISAADAAAALARGIASVDASIHCDQVPMSDGGEGTSQALAAALGGELIGVPCHDALRRATRGTIGWVPKRSLAVVEVAEAAGLEAIAVDDRDLWRATSRGVGELIAAALDRGATDFIIGLGGSATNDAGAGMLSALGARFLDRDGAEVADGPAGLLHLDSVDLSRLDPRFRRARIRIACDVSNPLLGSSGASAVYGPQKGAAQADLARFDSALRTWADVMEAATATRVRDISGAGAAGGLGAAFAVATEASLHSGVELVMDTVGLRDTLRGADWVFTGEGKIDHQTASGKTPWGVALAARSLGVPSILFGGQVTADAETLVGDAVQAVVPIVFRLAPLQTALAEGAANLQRAAAMVTRLLLTSRSSRA